MLKAQTIQTAEILWTEEGCLSCPRCGSGYLHHEAVTIFNRDEDAQEMVTVVTPTRLSQTQEPSAGSGNPSSRRSGLTVRFTCEECCWELPNVPLMELTIAQHKGATYMEWRFEPMSNRCQS